MSLTPGWAEDGGREQAALDRSMQHDSPRYREMLRQREWALSQGRKVDGYGRDLPPKRESALAALKRTTAFAALQFERETTDARGE